MDAYSSAASAARLNACATAGLPLRKVVMSSVGHISGWSGPALGRVAMYGAHSESRPLARSWQSQRARPTSSPRPAARPATMGLSATSTEVTVRFCGIAIKGSPARTSASRVATAPSPKLTELAAPFAIPFSTVNHATSSRAAAWSTLAVAGGGGPPAPPRLISCVVCLVVVTCPAHQPGISVPFDSLVALALLYACEILVLG
mmetsp:Transcript_6642/g.16507  ORF Transcript_6642/g.16507 Transcript_6642/m.16507 type:complete len:203 (+) Transcript_6642:1151-1759(+)